MGSCSLFQEIFPTPGLNLGLLHSRQILYHLSSQGSLPFLRDNPTSLNPLSKCAFMPLISPQVLFCFYINRNFHTQLFIQRLKEIHPQSAKNVISELSISVLRVTWHSSLWCDSPVIFFFFFFFFFFYKTLILKFLL